MTPLVRRLLAIVLTWGLTSHELRELAGSLRLAAEATVNH
jgi:hypothetical protein